ncbi:hypothetical protein F2Q68_00010142 [Brassica cretica]|uniref:TFIIS central domain-containing protein n=1 Tax=Brassica cretica TaxID=69181 RepID=A0A8S9KV25_BRACR|nr:hypothetical protein F2Q68_00010142 [Brassica cretica]
MMGLDQTSPGPMNEERRMVAHRQTLRQGNGKIVQHKEHIKKTNTPAGTSCGIAISSRYDIMRAEGLTAKETEKNEPDDAEKMQMTDARCSRCSQIKVGLRDIIQAGLGDRYQLECIACGHSWYASRDEVSTLTIDSEKPAQGTESEDVEKDLTSPREAEKKAKEDESLKTTNDTNVDNNPETTKKPE